MVSHFKFSNQMSQSNIQLKFCYSATYKNLRFCTSDSDRLTNTHSWTVSKWERGKHVGKCFFLTPVPSFRFVELWFREQVRKSSLHNESHQNPGLERTSSTLVQSSIDSLRQVFHIHSTQYLQKVFDYHLQL